MERPIITLRLPDAVKSKFQSEGYDTIEDIQRCLKSVEGVPAWADEVFRNQDVLHKIDSCNDFSNLKSAAVLSLNFSTPIAIFHRGLANLLQGGLALSQIMEICGPPGSGKTQLCLQFCVDVQIPRELGGAAGEVLYISTDFGFQVERLEQIARGTISHFASAEYSDSTTKKKCLEHLTLNAILRRIKVLRICEVTGLYEVLRLLKNFFKDNENVKLLVIDSFSLPFTLDEQDPFVRTKTIAFFLNCVHDFAVKYKFAIVLTNQLATVVTRGGNSFVKPALGQAYAHRIHQRLILKDGRAYLSKNVCRPQLFTTFTVTSEGIR